MTIEANTAADLDLLALIVKRLLRDRHAASAPVRADYAIAERGEHGQGGSEVHVHVDLGRGTKVRVEDMWIASGWDDLERLTSIAGDIADAIESVLSTADETRDMLREVRAAAKREVAKANRRGLPWRLIEVEPSPVAARGRGEGPMAIVTLEVVGETPVPAITRLDACCADDVREELGSLIEKQLQLASTWRVHALTGATGAIDATVYADLVGAGYDMPALLRQLAESKTWFLDLLETGGRRRVLHWSKGVVHGTVDLGEGAHLHEGQLSFKAAPTWIGPRIRGRALAELIPHPALGSGVTVLSTYGETEGYGGATCTVPILLFDAETGRVWEPGPEALAA